MVEVTAPWKDSDATPERREAAGLRDERLIPAIVELVAAPRLAKIASTSWDPVSTTQTRRLLDAFHHIREFEVSEAALEVRTGSAPCHMCRAVLTSGCIVAQAVLEGVLKRLQGAAFGSAVPIRAKKFNATAKRRRSGQRSSIAWFESCIFPNATD